MSKLFQTAKPPHFFSIYINYTTKCKHLLQCRLAFKRAPQLYASDITKIKYFISQLMGDALRWVHMMFSHDIDLLTSCVFRGIHLSIWSPLAASWCCKMYWDYNRAEELCQNMPLRFTSLQPRPAGVKQHYKVHFYIPYPSMLRISWLPEMNQRTLMN